MFHTQQVPDIGLLTKIQHFYIKWMSKFANGNLRVQFMYSYVSITIQPNIMWCKNASPE